MKHCRNTRPPTRRTRGFTLIEVVVVVALVATAFAAVTTTLLAMSGAASALVKRESITARQMLVMDRITHELALARNASLVPPNPQQSTSLRFDGVADVVGGVPVLSDPMQIELVALPGTAPAPGGFAIRVWVDRPPTGTVPGAEDAVSVISQGLPAEGLQFTRIGSYLRVDLQRSEVVDRGAPPEMFRASSGVTLRQ